MAIFRKINVNFWEDEKVVDDFTPEDRFFMLYLMTNPHTNQIGCYKITLKQMEFETGYNKETIEKLLSRFEKIHNVIKYSNETKEVLILNWYKYNWSNSPKVIACMNKEFKSIKNKEFRYSIDRVCKQYEYNIHTESQEEEEKEEKEEVSKEQTEVINKYFTTFYSKYPNKKSKQKAYTIFCAILKNKKATFEQLMEGLNKYVAYINQNKIEKSYIKHPTTWLNQGCWEDEYEELDDSWKGNPLLADFCEEMTKRDVERAKAEGML